MTDENRYGEFECKAPECEAVFMDREVRDRHYRRSHRDGTPREKSDTDDPHEHGPPLPREELVNPPDDAPD